jgi:tRNA dimethylallyltransferase
MQVYRGMDIGTAKPSASMRTILPHHLIDIVPPSSQYNAGLFVKTAESLVQEIRGRGRVPIVCGGTAFYITSFLCGLPESPPGDVSTMRALRARERKEGLAALYEELITRDPLAADRIQRNDRQRILRALEILDASGRSVFSHRWPREWRQGLDPLVIGLDRERDDLYRRIGERVDRMFASGLLEEVKSLVAKGCKASDPGMRGIGYREFMEMREACTTISQVRERIARNSRRYAKRQLTFFRSIPGVLWRNPNDIGSIRACIGTSIGVDLPGRT